MSRSDLRSDSELPLQGISILIIDDDPSFHIACKRAFIDQGVSLHSAYSLEEATHFLEKHSFQLSFVDMYIQGEPLGLKALDKISQIQPQCARVVTTGSPQPSLAKTSLLKGADLFLTKPLSDQQIFLVARSLLEKNLLQNQNQFFKNQQKRSLKSKPFLGNSISTIKLLQFIEKAKGTPHNILIHGETGSGKELVARLLASSTEAPFVAIDSSTIHSATAESLLFGSEKGAYTGSYQTTKGLFEEAQGGTVYFDEVANMPLEIQRKLLRVLQEKEITRLGSRKTIPLNFRVISATNQNLDDLCSKGLFLFDLYQRINVIPIRVEPLRNRIDDIDVLIPSFFQTYSPHNSSKTFSAPALKTLKNYPWPGNVRELQSLLAYLCTMLPEMNVYEVEDLPEKIRDHQHPHFDSISLSEKSFSQQSVASQRTSLPLDQISYEIINALQKSENVNFYNLMTRLEGRVLATLFDQFQGNLSKFSRTLGISRSHLYAKLNKHNIHPQTFDRSNEQV